MDGAEWRRLREAAHLTQREAALLAGIHLRTIVYLEGGKRRATPGMARWLAWIYDREARRYRG